MAQFIAIPVNQGDAFYFSRGDWSVLVDGGRSQAGFPSLFKNVTGANGVTILVCTHNDADHANGVLGFLEAGLSCEEIWLPGRWLALLPAVLKSFEEVFCNLLCDLHETKIDEEVEKLSHDFSLIEAFAQHLRTSLDSETTGIDEQLGVGGWTELHVQLLEQAKDWEIPAWPLFLHPKFYCYYDGIDSVKAQLLWSAIDAAHRIRAISIEAFHRGIPVRWFEFSHQSQYGGMEELKPINANEIARVRPQTGRLLDLLALSVSNKECLAFWSPPTEQHPGVLFSGDSDLASANIPPALFGAIATAPHHGSEANSDAYRTIKSVANGHFSSITWVRSDGRYRNRPGSTFLRLTSQRYCTICRHHNTFTRKNAVCLFPSANSWISYNCTIPCSCS